MADKLQIVVEADISQLQIQLKKAENDLKAFQNQLSKTGDNTNFNSLNKKISETKDLIASIKARQIELTIIADTTQVEKAKTEIDSIKSKQLEIFVNADTTELNTVQSEINKIQSKAVELIVNADTTELNTVQSDINKIQSKAVELIVNADTTDLNTVQSDINKIQSKAVEVVVVADTTAINVVQTDINAIKTTPIELMVVADTTQINTVQNDINSIQSTPVVIPVDADTTPLVAGVNDAEAKLSNIPPVTVPISVDTRLISAQLQLAENDLKAFTAELRNATNTQDVIKLQNSIGLLKNKIGDLKGSLGAADSGLKKVAGQTNSAAYAVTNLGRIVSDSAYGFIGIANNITPFVDSLASARKEAAATGKSLLSNLGASLAGPAGLSLAFAAVTTAITFAQIGFSAWTRKSKEAKDAVDEVKKSQEEFAKSLDSAKSSALSSGIALQSYVDVAKNSTLPIEQRNEALKKANEILGDHGKVLTLASIATAEGTKEIELYTKALIAQAVATKYTDKIAELTIQQTNLNNQLKQSNIDLATAQKTLANKINESANAYKNATYSANSYGSASSQISSVGADVIDKVNTALENRNKLQLKLTSTTTDIINLNANLKSSTEDATAAFGAMGTKTKDAAKGTETLAQALAKFEEKLISAQSVGFSLGTPQFDINKDKIKEFENILGTVIEKFNVSNKDTVYVNLEARLQDLKYDQLLLKLKSNLENAAKAVLLPLSFELKPNIKLPGVIKIPKIEIPSLKDIQTGANLAELFSGLPANYFKPFSDDTLGSIVDQTNSFFTALAVDAAVLFGQTLGDALTGQASIGDFFKGIFASLGTNLESLGKFLVKTAIEIELIQKTLFTNPFLAIAGGIALIAIGRAISNRTNRNAFAVGTRNAPGGMALVGERGPELINLPRGSQVIPAAQTSQMMGGVGGQIEVFGMLRGQDIFFSNKKYGQTYGRTT
jgi:hypothetical protein